MTGEKHLIVNADDFGQSAGVNRGIIEAHEHGIVTSASLMVRWPAALEAAAYAREHSSLSVGIHLDLGEWMCRGGAWTPVYSVVPVDDEDAVKREIKGQLERYRALIGKDPTHVNSHQHVHMREPVRSVVIELCRELGVPPRNLCPEIHYIGTFYGQTTEGLPVPAQISVQTLIATLSAVAPGFTVLICHPGYADDLGTMYRAERSAELRTLCDPRVRQAIGEQGITLCSFTEWAQARSDRAAVHGAS